MSRSTALLHPLLDNRGLPIYFSNMSLAELETLVSGLTDEERKTLRNILNAAEEGVSIEEWDAMDTAVDEALKDRSPTIPADQVFAELRALYPLPHASQA